MKAHKWREAPFILGKRPLLWQLVIPVEGAWAVTTEGRGYCTDLAWDFYETSSSSGRCMVGCSGSFE